MSLLPVANTTARTRVKTIFFGEMALGILWMKRSIGPLLHLEGSIITYDCTIEICKRDKFYKVDPFGKREETQTQGGNGVRCSVR
jgi:hypothetical protein